MEAQGSNNRNNFTHSKTSRLSQELDKLTPSPPRKKKCPSHDSSKMSCPGYDIVTAETGLSPAKRHSVEMTLFGAICFDPGCMMKLGRSFHTVSEKSLRKHFDANQCYTGHRPDCTNLARSLNKDRFTLQELVQKGGAQADALVERVLPDTGVTRSKGSYCINCGLVGRPGQLRKQHYTDQNRRCSIKHLRCDGTIVRSSIISNMKTPEELVTLIRLGKFQWKDPQGKAMKMRMQSIEKKDVSRS